MAHQFLKLETHERIAWLEYHRPPVNAFNWEMIREVSAALDELTAEREVRVVVIASALEKHFSVGADLELFRGMGREGMREWMTIVHGIVNKLRASPKPLLAAIHGTAVGAGAEMIQHCDVRFAAANARFGQPEIAINLLPGVGTTQSLARLMGRTRAIRFLYDGVLVGAEQARHLGLVDVVAPPEKLRQQVQEYAVSLAQKPPEALAAIRRTITEGMDLPFEEALRIEFETEVELAATRNFQEGVAAFLEKRKPNWE